MNTQEKQDKKRDFMLDTVAIKIIYPDFKVTRPDLFSPDLKIRMTDKIPAGYTPKSLFRKRGDRAGKRFWLPE